MKRHAPALLAAAIVAAIAFATWRFRETGVQPRTAPVAATLDPAPDADGQSRAARVMPVASRPAAMSPAAPLPDESLPLRETMATYDRLARAGNARAACRLASEIARCTMARTLPRVGMPLEERLQRIEELRVHDEEKRRYIDEARARDARDAAEAAHCAGLDADTTPAAARYFALAGRAGHAESQLAYLVPGVLTANDLLREPALGAEYRATAPDFFRQRLEAGDTRVLSAWLVAVALPDATPLSLALPDAYRSAGLLNALKAELDAMGGHPLRSEGMLNNRLPAPTDGERDHARRLFEDHFRHAMPPAQPQFDPFDHADQGMDIREACDASAG